MNAWWSAAAYWLVEVYAMATVVLAAALITLWRIRQPARRLAVARWTLLVLLCVPPLALLTMSSTVLSTVRVLQWADPAEVCYCDVSGAPGRDRLTALAAFYATCSGLVVAWLSLGALASARLRIRATEAPASLQTLLARVAADRSRYPRLHVGGVAQPVAIGLFQPTIVLPEWFAQTEPEASVEAAIAHEWAHLRRGDLWTLAVSRWLFVLFFAHPLFYVLRGRLRADQEAIADAEAAGQSGAIAYAEALVGWARRTTSRSLGSSLGLLGRPSWLRARVALLLDPGFRVELACPRQWTVAVRVSAVVLVLGLTMFASAGLAQTALSTLTGLVPPAAPHTHPSATNNDRPPSDSPSPRWILCCPPDSPSPRWNLCCEPREVRCQLDVK